MLHGKNVSPTAAAGTQLTMSSRESRTATGDQASGVLRSYLELFLNF